MAACLLLVFAALLLLPAAAQAETLPLRCGSEIDYPPFCVVDAAGRADGFSVELLNAALDAMGREAAYRTGTWEEVKGWLRDGEVTALPLVGRTPEREAVFDFTVPYMSLYGAIVVRQGTDDVRSLADLRGREIAVMVGDNAEEFLRRQDLGAEIRTTATFEEALARLSQGEFDAVVCQRLVAIRLIDEAGLGNLEVLDKPVEGFKQDFCFAVREGDSSTLALLNEGLALVIADGTYRHLHAKWFASLELPSNQRIIVGGDYNYPPYEYLDENGDPAGYNVDLTRAIARQLGLEVDIRLGPWVEVKEAFERGEIDVMQGMYYSPDRDLAFDFSPPHMTSNGVAVVRSDAGEPADSVAGLHGKSILVQAGDIMHEFALANGLEADITAVPDPLTALRGVESGTYDCALMSRVTALHFIDSEGLAGLVVGKSALRTSDYCYAVLNGQSALLAQFSEGLALLKDSGEYRQIQEEWMGVYEGSTLTAATVLRYTVLVAGPLFVLLLGAFVWSWSLRRTVARRTRDLRASEEQYRLLADNSLDAIWTTDLDLRFTYINPASLPMLGYAPEEWMGTLLQDHCTAESYASMYASVAAKIFQGPQAPGVIFEGDMLRKDGTTIPVEVHARAVYDAHGRPVGLQGITRDITERRRAERERQITAHAIKHARLGLLALDRQGRVREASEFMSSLLGYSRAELQTMTVFDFTVGLDPGGWPTRWEELKRKGPVVFEKVWRKKSGDTTTVEISCSIVDFEGAELDYAFIRDISERKAAERRLQERDEQLRQAQKMEAVGQLAGGIAHDFNNLLMAIIGNSSLALETMGRDDPNRELLVDIKEVGERAAVLTKQILAFSRRQILKPQSVCLNDIVRGLQPFLRRTLPEDIDVQFHLVDDLAVTEVDYHQMEQVLMNLAVNARDAMPGGGALRIETASAVLDEEFCGSHPQLKPGDYVRLTVQDDGCGMDEDTLSHMFEPFFTTKEVGKGTGLGLSTVFGVVNQSKGAIVVTSGLGEGTAFEIYLPTASAPPEVQSAPADEQPVRGGGETILVVEDGGPVRQLVTRTLERSGYRVLQAGSAAEADACLRRQASMPHLLLTDLVLPGGVNGVEVARRLRRRAPRLPVIFMSGYPKDTVLPDLRGDPGAVFLEKPVSPDGLLREVRAALDRHARASMAQETASVCR